MPKSSPKEILTASNLTTDDLRERIKNLLREGLGIEQIRAVFFESLVGIGYGDRIIQSALVKFNRVKLEINKQKRRRKSESKTLTT